MISRKLLKLLAIGSPLLLTICVLVIVFLLTRPAQMPGSDEIFDDCDSSFCGCWKDTTLVFSATFVNEAGEPIRGIEICCDGEHDPIATSDREGAAIFTIETAVSPGCQYLRCTNLKFSDPDHRYKTLQTTVFLTNQSTVELESMK
jgi:hypothetical protein